MWTPPRLQYPLCLARARRFPGPGHRVPRRVVRIAVVAPPWVPVPPVAYGGTEAALDVLCRGLVGRGHDVLLVTTGDAEVVPGVENASLFDVPVAGLGSSGEPGSEPVLVRTAEIEHAAFAHMVASDWGADVVHDHTVSGPAFGSARRAAGIGPAVLTTHHGAFDDRVGSVFVALSHVVPLVALSEAHARSSRGARIEAVIHHGVDIDRYRPVQSHRSGAALFVGRMSPDKGLEVAIRAARRAGVELVIAAKMREMAEHRFFEERIRPLLSSGIDYVGEVARNDLVRLMAESVCLLNPIRWHEPFGLVVIEALACGLPVVTTPRGAMVELVDDGRTGFIRSTEDGLAEALRHVDRIDREQCRRVAVERFSMDRVAADHEAVYATVLQRTEPPRSTPSVLA